jgi:hypothetical protein
MTKDMGLIEDKSSEKIPYRPKLGFTILEAAAIAQTCLNEAKPKLAITRALRKAFLMGQGKEPFDSLVIPPDTDLSMIEEDKRTGALINTDLTEQLSVERAMFAKLKVQYSDLENRMKAKDQLLEAMQRARSVATERVSLVIDQREDAYKLVHSLLTDRLSDVEHSND